MSLKVKFSQRAKQDIHLDGSCEIGGVGRASRDVDHALRPPELLMQVGHAICDSRRPSLGSPRKGSIPGVRGRVEIMRDGEEQTHETISRGIRRGSVSDRLK